MKIILSRDKLISLREKNVLLKENFRKRVQIFEKKRLIQKK